MNQGERKRESHRMQQGISKASDPRDVERHWRGGEAHTIQHPFTIPIAQLPKHVLKSQSGVRVALNTCIAKAQTLKFHIVDKTSLAWRNEGSPRTYSLRTILPWLHFQASQCQGSDWQVHVCTNVANELRLCACCTQHVYEQRVSILDCTACHQKFTTCIMQRILACTSFTGMQNKLTKFKAMVSRITNS